MLKNKGCLLTIVLLCFTQAALAKSSKYEAGETTGNPVISGGDMKATKNIMAPINKWFNNFERFSKRAKQMRGQVYITGGLVQQLDCKKLVVVVKPRIGNPYIVNFASIQNVKIINPESIPIFCKKSKWLMVGNRITIQGFYRFMNNKNLVSKANIEPYRPNF